MREGTPPFCAFIGLICLVFTAPRVEVGAASEGFVFMPPNLPRSGLRIPSRGRVHGGCELVLEDEIDEKDEFAQRTHRGTSFSNTANSPSVRIHRKPRSSKERITAVSASSLT